MTIELRATRPSLSVDNPVTKAVDNDPALWKNLLPRKAADRNKYDFGHVLVYGGEHMTGATRLAAEAIMRVGAGLCTVSAPPKAAAIYRAACPANIIVEDRPGPSSFRTQMKDTRRNALLIGPGAEAGSPGALRAVVLHAAQDGRSCVLDADALSVFKGNRRAFYKALGAHCVLTPHEGEFARIFPDLEGSRIERAHKAADMSGAIILLKGAETIMASPTGKIVVNKTSSPDLATAGTGDVLAGLIAGLLARGLAPFDAACAGAWIHGRAAQLFGIGLMATDLPAQIPAVLREIA